MSEIKNWVVDGTEKLKNNHERISLHLSRSRCSALNNHTLSNTYLLHSRNVSFHCFGSKSYALRRASFLVQHSGMCKGICDLTAFSYTKLGHPRLQWLGKEHHPTDHGMTIHIEYILTTTET